MIIVSINGGLGNQLFQYAFGKHLAYLHHKEVLFDLSVFDNPAHRPFALNHFQVSIKKADQNQLPYSFRKSYKKLPLLAKLLNKLFYSHKYIHQKQFDFNPAYLENKNKSYYWGYWQSEKYFSGVKELVKKQYAFKNSDITRDEAIFIQQIENTDSISVHIRRGDYIDNELHPICDITYYEKAIKIMADKLHSPHFFIFSDDIYWCKAHLKINFKHSFITIGEAWKELRLMTYCKHNIIANSSFSWWGAYLGNYNKKIVICPKKWFLDESNYNTKDLRPENWIII